ncbi:MAG: hypothetical protein IJ811_03330 [Clostridia bacterium]|nr:hypothetical protein [Clostridia bacterium]
MYWLLDVAFIALLAIVVVEGYRVGILGMVSGVFAFILRFLFTVVVTALFVFLMEITGATQALALPITKALGESNIYETQMLAYFIAVAIFAVVGIAISIFALFFIVRALKKKKIKKDDGKRNPVNGILGLIVALVLYCAFVLLLLGFVNALAQEGGLTGLDEAFRACPVLSLIYVNNPLTALISSTKLPEYLISAITGRFKDIMGAL